MIRSVQTATDEVTAASVAARFVKEGIGSLVVTDPATDDILGIVTESDIIRHVAMGTDMEAVPVSALMSAPIVTIASTETIAAADLMRDHSIRRVPVVDDGRLVGIVTTTDLAHYLPRLRQTISRDREAEH